MRADIARARLIAEARAAAALAEPFTPEEKRDLYNAAARRYLYGQPVSAGEKMLLERWGEELVFRLKPARR